MGVDSVAQWWLPVEIFEEILEGRKDDDILLDWIKNDKNREALLFDEAVTPQLVQLAVSVGYADDLTDDEVEKLGRDPFLVAYALASHKERAVVTTEISKPSKQRQNRKLPDVCAALEVTWVGPFEFNRLLGFHTGWKL